MEDLVIENESGKEIENGELNLREVAAVIEKSEEILTNWRSLARLLDINEVDIIDLGYRVNLGTFHMKDIPYEVVKLWKAKKGSGATLEAICEAFINSGSIQAAEMLQKSINSDGTLILRQEVTKPEEFYSKIAQFLKSHIEPRLRRKYYIPRTFLIYGNEVDTGIFKAALFQKSLLLFKGITKSQLARLTDYKLPIGKSGEAMHEGIQFILLEYDKDYEDICKSTNKPVHVFELQNNDKFHWIKSSQNLEMVQMFLQKYSITEEDMIYKILSTHPPSGFIVTDSPGMGKTLVLTNWANTIRDRRLDNIVVLFIVLQEFVQNLETVIDTPTTALKFVLAYSTSENTEKSVPVETLITNCSSLQFYLFLDGYDEIAEEKLVIADSFLRHIKQVENWKVFVATRPHLKSRLENILCQHSIKIMPFDNNNQTDFLTKYWITKHGAVENENLKTFAKQCLTALENELTDKEKKIAGIPLQCRMLAEVYADDAVRSSKMTPGSLTTINIISIFDMYKKLVHLKFSCISDKATRKKYINAHVYESVALLFPHWIDKFKPHLKNRKKIKENMMYSIGLVEKSPHSNSTYRFMHRTFAEFFLAKFIVENLKKFTVCSRLVFTEILGVKGITVEESNYKWSSHEINFYKFKYPTIVYFIDMHCKDNLKNFTVRSLEIKNLQHVKHEDLYITLAASCCQDLKNIFDLTQNLLDVLKNNIFSKLFKKDDSKELLEKYLKDVLHLVTINSENVTLVKKVVNFTKQNFEADYLNSCNIKNYYLPGNANFPFMIENCSPLHLAVSKGNYNVVTCLLQEYGDQATSMKALVHACVYKTSMSSSSVIEDKLLIIDLLSKQNSTCLEESYQGRTPILQEDVHVMLLKHLVKNGANINAYSKAKGTILHRASDKNTYADLVHWALSNNFSRINDTDLPLKRTPIMIAFKLLEADMNEKLLEKFCQFGANFNAQDRNGDSVLFYALKESSNINILRKLLDYGAKIYHTNKRKENAAHLVIKNQKLGTNDAVNIINLLLSRGFYEKNERDEYDYTPLMYCYERSRFNEMPLIRLFDNKVVNEDSLLFHAIKYSRDADFILRLLDGGVNINGIDKDGQSILDIVIDYAPVKDSKVALDTIKLLLFRAKQPQPEVSEYFKQKRWGAIFTRFIRKFRHIDSEMLEFFKDVGTNVNSEFFSLLFYVLSYSNDIDLVKSILDFHADLNHVNHLGETAAHFVVRTRYCNQNLVFSLLKLFHERGLDLSKENFQGETPLDYAKAPYREYGEELIQFLEDKEKWRGLINLCVSSSLLAMGLTSQRH